MIVLSILLWKDYTPISSWTGYDVIHFFIGAAIIGGLIWWGERKDNDKK